MPEITLIKETEDYFKVHFDNGTIVFQRKFADVGGEPLNTNEKLILALCRYNKKPWRGNQG